MISLKALIPVLAIATLPTLVSHEAAAAETPACVPDRVDFDGNRIALWCKNESTIYYAFKSGFNSCAGQTVDTLKTWTGMIQSALLSGKPVDLFYNAPAGACVDRTITSVGLKAQ